MDEHDLTTDNLTKQWDNSIEHVEDKVGNSEQPMFDGTDIDRVYSSAFGDTDNAENNVLP